MRIVFTGGGTGGHFYPLIAVAEALREECDKEHIVQPKLYYLSDSKIDEGLLAGNEIDFVFIPAGKLRMSGSIFGHVSQMFRALGGVFVALQKLFKIYPDVIFAKGGYASFPTLFAARILGIPIILHESDTTPGRVSLWAGKFAKLIATAFPEATLFFKKEKTACVGLPIREAVLHPIPALPVGFIRNQLPLILVVGGSQGAQKINEAIVEALPELVNDFQIVHQTGIKNLDETIKDAALLAPSAKQNGSYFPIGNLNGSELHTLGTQATLVISRAGSMLFEIGSWGVASILIPITDSHGDHQRKNAFSFARAGGCEVIEEANLTPHLLASEIKRLQADAPRRAEMSAKAKMFAKTDAAALIAEEILKIALAHT